MQFADRRKAVVVVVGSVLVTSALVALILSLGSWAFQTRRFLLHERRLAPLVEKHATLEDISAALLAEPGNREIPAPEFEEDFVALVGQWRGGRDPAILAKRRSARDVLIFGVRDMVYVLFFDAESRLQAYVLLGN